MKMMVGVFLLGILSVLLVGYYGGKNRDAAVGKKIYKQANSGELAAKVLAVTDFSWDIDCKEENCRVTVSISPEPEKGTLALTVSRPAEASTLNSAWAGVDGTWAADFKKAAKGWYMANVVYQYDGVRVSQSKSFYLH